MLEPHRLIAPTIGLIASAAALAAAAVALLPEALIPWVPAVVGASWTAALVWLARRLRHEPGVGGRSLRRGAIACGLLTLVAVSVGVRQEVGWPELVLSLPAMIALGLWAWETVRELRARRRLPPAPPRPVLDLRERDARRRTRWM